MSLSVRLNGWQRVGIIASVMWFLLGGYLGNDSVMAPAVQIRSEEHISCWHEHDNATNRISLNDPWRDFLISEADRKEKECLDKVNESYPGLIAGHWQVAALWAFAPLPIGWLLAYTILGLFRWVRAGFRQKQISN